MDNDRDIKKSAEFDHLLAAYGGVINKVCFFYASDTNDFDDLRQEALLNIWRGIDTYRGEANISTWIYRITLNSCVSYFRKNRFRRNAEPIENHPELISDDEEKSLLIKEMYALINELGQIDKAIILLWLDGYDYISISEVMGMTKATVGTRIKRIKDKLVKISNG